MLSTEGGCEKVKNPLKNSGQQDEKERVHHTTALLLTALQICTTAGR
jgi:hypothetical protein